MTNHEVVEPGCTIIVFEYLLCTDTDFLTMDLDEPLSLLREEEQPAWLLCCAGCIASTAEIIWIYTTKGYKIYNIYYGIFQKERTPEYRTQVFKISGEQQKN
jgi:hypothetical protein